MSTDIRAIAFYLPQFHPITENDEWWGKGFTEWTNVAKAKPLFKGHYQPKLPADLGFYDLRIPEVREAQAQLAKDFGIHGFCYWHYWFGNGKRILERPFNEVLKSNEPNLPLCLAWANESWSGIWHGNPKKVLAQQVYPGRSDYEAHFQILLSAFHDSRYIRVDNKPLFIVYLPDSIPDINVFVETFQEMAIKNGLPGIHLVATNVPPTWESKKYGFDAITISNHNKLEYLRSSSRAINLIRRKKNNRYIKAFYNKILKRPIHIYEYEEAMQLFINEDVNSNLYYPMVIPNWDNTARSGVNGFVLNNSTPELFREAMVKAKNKISTYNSEHKIIFIKSWNEWAEGNYLEPDKKWGHQYLQVVKDVLKV